MISPECANPKNRITHLALIKFAEHQPHPKTVNRRKEFRDQRESSRGGRKIESWRKETRIQTCIYKNVKEQKKISHTLHLWFIKMIK